MILDDLSGALQIAITNFTSITVLAFVLGLVAALVRSDLRLPEPVYKAVSFVLLLAIGLKGGVALRASTVGEIAGPVAVTIGLGILVPILAFLLLRVLTPLGRIDRGAIAAHYGSTSLVTFTAALVLLEGLGIFAEGYLPTLLTVMEVPGIVVGLLLATQGDEAKGSWRMGLREVLTSASVLLLVGGLVLGAISGADGYKKVEPLFGSLFQGLLALFLLHLGTVVGRSLGQLRSAGWGLVVFALAFPLIVGSVGVLVGTAIGVSVGGATMLGVLCASASYIAAPAAVEIALPEAKETIALGAALGVTFPFNLLLGIPLLLLLAQTLGT